MFNRSADFYKSNNRFERDFWKRNRTAFKGIHLIYFIYEGSLKYCKLNQKCRGIVIKFFFFFYSDKLLPAMLQAF